MKLLLILAIFLLPIHANERIYIASENNSNDLFENRSLLPLQFSVNLQGYSTISGLTIENKKVSVLFNSIVYPQSLLISTASPIKNINIVNEKQLVYLLKTNDELPFFCSKNENIYLYNLSGNYKAYVSGIDKREYLKALIFYKSQFVGSLEYGIPWRGKKSEKVNINIFENILFSIQKNPAIGDANYYYKKARRFQETDSIDAALMMAISCVVIEPKNQQCIQIIKDVFKIKSVMFGTLDTMIQPPSK